MAIAAVVISILALLFTLGSFWWLNARRGSLEAATPQSYAFVDGFRLRLPLALFKEIIAEFGDNHQWLPKPGSAYRIHLEAMVHPNESWNEVLVFSWWAPPKADLMTHYIAHRNRPASS